MDASSSVSVCVCVFVASRVFLTQNVSSSGHSGRVTTGSSSNLIHIQDAQWDNDIVSGTHNRYNPKDGFFYG